MPHFNSPTFERKLGRPHELWFVPQIQSKTVVKHNGQWRTVVTPTEDFIATCEVVLRGGYLHEISDELAAELTDAGYGDYITA